MVTILENHPSVLNQFLIEVRDINQQSNRLVFRNNIERIGEILAYEISKTLDYSKTNTQTPLGESPELELTQHPIIISILRAGIPLHNGMLKIFDHAGNGFIGASRVKSDQKETQVHVGYEAWPPLDNEIVIVADPMLATGTSLDQTIASILNSSKPKEVHIACVIAYEGALNELHKKYPEVNFWIAGVDKSLNEKNYIYPGLGDAGDLAYGSKIQ